MTEYHRAGMQLSNSQLNKLKSAKKKKKKAFVLRSKTFLRNLRYFLHNLQLTDNYTITISYRTINTITITSNYNFERLFQRIHLLK